MKNNIGAAELTAAPIYIFSRGRLYKARLVSVSSTMIREKEKGKHSFAIRVLKGEAGHINGSSEVTWTLSMSQRMDYLIS